MKDKKHCNGCRDDFYNGRTNFGGGKTCWSLPKSTIVTRYRIHRDQVPTQTGAFTKMRVRSCYNNPPWFYYEKLPDFAIGVRKA